MTASARSGSGLDVPLEVNRHRAPAHQTAHRRAAVAGLDLSD